jgi:hypothetical protein
MKTVSIWLAMTLAPALAVAALRQPSPPRGPVAYIVSQRITNETNEGKAGVARMQALQRERMQPSAPDCRPRSSSSGRRSSAQ